LPKGVLLLAEVEVLRDDDEDDVLDITDEDDVFGKLDFQLVCWLFSIRKSFDLLSQRDIPVLESHT
jgi:hypothetical protein